MTAHGMKKVERHPSTLLSVASGPVGGAREPVTGEMLAAAIEQHKRGEFGAAEDIYRRFLEFAPDHPEVLHLLGVIRFQQGDPETAQSLIRRAIAQNPKRGDYCANLGAALQALGHLEDAESAYGQALALDPNQTEPFTNLAVVYSQTGRLEQAKDACRRAIAVNPRLLKAHLKLADLSLEAQDYDGAAEALERAVALSPGEAQAWNNLGVCYERTNQFDRALRCYQRAVELDGELPEYLNNLGALLRLLGRSAEGEPYLQKAKRAELGAWQNPKQRAQALSNMGDYDGAVEILLREAEAGSEDVEVLSGLGASLCAVRRFTEAHRWLVKALELKPDYAEAMFFLGTAFMGLKEGWQAEAAFRKALELKPGYLQPHLAVCEIMDIMQRRDEANVWGRASVLLEGFTPNLMVYPFKAFRGSCDFEAIEQLGDIWDAAEKALPIGNVSAAFLYLLVEADTVEKAKRLTALHRAYGERLEAQAARNPLPALRFERGTGKLRVGLLSYDMRSHSVANFVLPLLRNYDREQLELVVFSLMKAPGDPVQEEIRGLVDRFHDVEIQTDRGLAEFVRQDGTDVLIDLGGFTVGSRLTALVHRMAPIQIAWLGFPNTTGFKTVDYVLVDPRVAPTEPALFVEKALPVAHSWVCFEGYPEIPIDPTPPCERNGYVTFGTLNNTYKFTPACIAAWAEVLHAVPDSRFLLGRPEGQNRMIAENLMKAFGRHGIDPERVLILTNKVRQNFQSYNQIDVALDCFPLTGGTTTCDALWMGVPTVTLRGAGMHQRLSHSLLNNVHLAELSTDTAADFVRVAAALAHSPADLRLLRAHLRDVVRNSPLCRGDIFAEDFREAMWAAARARGLR